MHRSHSTSPARGDRGKITFGWVFGKGLCVTATVLGNVVGTVVITPGMVYTAACVAAGAATVVVSAGVVVVVSAELYRWATTPEESNEESTQASPEMIRAGRNEEGFSDDFSHVAVCGPAGSGKTSIINALRGLRNNHPFAARVGTAETTTTRTKYPAHSSFDTLMLYDCPGAGTLRIPAAGYYNAQKLHLFDIVLIVLGARFGEVENSIIKACIKHRQTFIIVSSRSDEKIHNISRDEKCDDLTARDVLIRTTTEAIKSEFQRAGIPKGALDELLGFCILVNKDDLRALSEVNHAQEWPDGAVSRNEIHERLLAQILRKTGTTISSSGPKEL